MFYFANMVPQKGQRPRLQLTDNNGHFAELSLPGRAARLLACWCNGQIASFGDEEAISKAASDLRIALANSSRTHGPNAAVLALLRVFATKSIIPRAKCGFRLLIQDRVGILPPGYDPIAPREIERGFAALLRARTLIVSRDAEQLVAFAKAARVMTNKLDELVETFGIHSRELIELLRFGLDRPTEHRYTTDIGKLCREIAPELLDPHIEKLHANLDPADPNLDRLVAVLFALQVIRRPLQAPSILFACRCSSNASLLRLARLYDEAFRDDQPTLRPH